MKKSIYAFLKSSSIMIANAIILLAFLLAVFSFFSKAVEPVGYYYESGTLEQTIAELQKELSGLSPASANFASKMNSFTIYSALFSLDCGPTEKQLYSSYANGLGWINLVIDKGAYLSLPQYLDIFSSFISFLVSVGLIVASASLISDEFKTGYSCLYVSNRSSEEYLSNKLKTMLAYGLVLFAILFIPYLILGLLFRDGVSYYVISQDAYHALIMTPGWLWTSYLILIVSNLLSVFFFSFSIPFYVKNGFGVFFDVLFTFFLFLFDSIVNSSFITFPRSAMILYIVFKISMLVFSSFLFIKLLLKRKSWNFI